jgi:hypothetical protein
MQVIPIDIRYRDAYQENGKHGEWTATGVRIFAEKRFLEEVKSITLHNRYGDWDTTEAAQWTWGGWYQLTISNVDIHESSIRDQVLTTRGDYYINLSNDAASYLLGCLHGWAESWSELGFESAAMVRSALALERHLTEIVALAPGRGFRCQGS